MMQKTIYFDEAFHEGLLLQDVEVIFEHDLVTGISAEVDRSSKVFHRGVLSRGLVDLQVNGGGDVLFNLSPNEEGVRCIQRAHKKFGTDWIAPTVITDKPQVMQQAVDAVISLWGEYGIAGIHIEGPHISVEKRGTHSAEFIRPFDDLTMRQIERLREKSIPTMLTVAPESIKPEEIMKLRKMGTIVSIGHSNTSYEETMAAINAGAQCFTHLFNAMSPFQGRDPGVVGAAFQAKTHCGIILDGHHVHDASVQHAIDSIPDLFFVSDAMPTVGGKSEFELYGQSVGLKNGKLVNREGALAGAHTTMAESLHRAVSRLGIDKERALQMSLSIPANLFEIEKVDSLIGQSLDSLFVRNEDLSLTQSLKSFLAG